LPSEDDIKNNIYYASGINLPKQDNYETAYKEAVDELLKKDLKDVAYKTGAQIIQDDSSPTLILPFLTDEIIIRFPEASLSYKNKDAELGLWYKILILHYLVQAKGTRATSKQITFKQITGGLAYYPAFHRRTIKPLVKSFGNNLIKYIRAAEKTGGVKSGISRYSFSFQVFPKVSVIINLWEGDEELPSDGNIIFDSSIVDYLTTEDIAVLCNILALMIIKNGN
jgi:hypothetical protein